MHAIVVQLKRRPVDGPQFPIQVLKNSFRDRATNLAKIAENSDFVNPADKLQNFYTGTVRLLRRKLS